MSSPLEPLDPTRSALAPTGVLRVAINLGNVLLVTGQGEAGEPQGVAPSVGLAIGEALGVDVDLVGCPTPVEAGRAVADGECDICLIGADPAREAHLTFTTPYADLGVTALAVDRIGSAVELNRPGVRVASARGAAYTLWLERNLTEADLVHTRGIQAGITAFADGEVDAVVGLRSMMVAARGEAGRGRVLDDEVMVVEQAVALNRRVDDANDGAPHRWLQATVAALVADGSVADLIAAHGPVGVSPHNPDRAGDGPGS